MRVRVSLDIDILIESFISLCIIETVGAIFREYKPNFCTRGYRSHQMLLIQN
jgi:hypothetical protein